MNKINFIGIISAAHCNPNGDPLLGNRPRTDYNGYGEITDVCCDGTLILPQQEQR